MSDQCATCGAADVILFTCGYCDRAFCADHGLPNHSCEGFAHPGEDADEVAFEWGAGGRTAPEDPFSGSGFRAADDPGHPSEPPTPRSPSGTATAAVRPAPRRPPGPASQAIRPVPEPGDAPSAPAAPSPSSTSAGGGTVSATASGGADQPSSAPIRAMDSRRSPGSTTRSEPRTLMEWIDHQTYVSLSVKTAALATVINGALYLGMMVTLSGLLPV